MFLLLCKKIHFNLCSLNLLSKIIFLVQLLSISVFQCRLLKLNFENKHWIHCFGLLNRLLSFRHDFCLKLTGIKMSIVLDSLNWRLRFVSGRTGLLQEISALILRPIFVILNCFLSYLGCVNIIKINRKTAVSESISSKKLFFNRGRHPNI